MIRMFALSAFFLLTTHAAQALDTDFACADRNVIKSTGSHALAEWGKIYAPLISIRRKKVNDMQVKEERAKELIYKIGELHPKALAQLRHLSSESRGRSLLKTLFVRTSAFSDVREKGTKLDLKKTEALINSLNGKDYESIRNVMSHLLNDGQKTQPINGFGSKEDEDPSKQSVPICRNPFLTALVYPSKGDQSDSSRSSWYSREPIYCRYSYFLVTEMDYPKFNESRPLTKNENGYYRFSATSEDSDLDSIKYANTDALRSFKEFKERTTDLLNRSKQYAWKTISQIPLYSAGENLLEAAFQTAWIANELSFDRAVITYIDSTLSEFEKYDQLCRNAYAANVWKDADFSWAQSKLPNGLGYSDAGFKTIENALHEVGGRPDASFFENINSATNAH